MSSSLLPVFPLTTWHPCTSLLLPKMASLKFGGYPFCIQPSHRFCFECIFVWKYSESAKIFILFGWGMAGKAGGGCTVLNKEAWGSSKWPPESIPLAYKCSWSSKGSHLERGCAIPISTACYVSSNRNAVAVYCCRFLFCPSTIFVVVCPLTCCPKIHVTAWQTVLLIT